MRYILLMNELYAMSYKYIMIVTFLNAIFICTLIYYMQGIYFS